MKKTIRLSEVDLHRVIKESVVRILNEDIQPKRFRIDFYVDGDWQTAKQVEGTEEDFNRIYSEYSKLFNGTRISVLGYSENSEPLSSEYDNTIVGD